MDQLFMFSNEYSLDDMDEGATYSAKDSQIKEPTHLQNEGDNDSDYITSEQLKRDSTTATAKDDADDEDDNTIFNFGLEPQVKVNESPRRSLRPSSTVMQTSGIVTEDPNNPYINYELAVVYICPACGAEFNAQDVWKRHLNGVHNYNTRRGLNFMPLDKLYHKCLECNKRIAMHAMENLLKHKFTHLPHRCTKCNICMRQYKYRQDLMVHLRTNHRAELLAMTKSNGGSSGGRYDAGRYRGGGYNYNNRTVTSASVKQLEIKDIKENAIDIFENTCDSVEVKNELIEPDENDVDLNCESQPNNSKFVGTSMLEDALSRSSSHASDQRQIGSNDDDMYELHIQYICRVCQTEYPTKEQWREHMERVHDFGTVWGLGFKQIPCSKNVRCLECKKVFTQDNIQVLQLHKLSHLPNRAYVRCKLCFRSFSGPREVIKHLQNQHRLSNEYDSNADDSQDTRQFEPFADDDNDDGIGEDLLSDQPRGEDRDIYEPQIDYLCPQCGKEFQDKKCWRRHIVKIHHLTDLNVLNFEVINDREVKCRECDKIITNAYGVQNAQQHRITHMPYKAFIRCRMCAKSYTDRKGLVKHLHTVHRITGYSSVNQTTIMRNRQITPLYGTSSYQSKPARTAPVKEIVRHNDVTFEIQYLDDDDVTLDETPVPELSYSGRDGIAQQPKCSDCGAAFDTSQALRTHKQEEHEFLDFNNLKPLPESPHKQQSGSNTNYRHASLDAEQSNDGDDLLVPTGDEELSFASTSSSISNIEQYFCYLCPACGKEFKIQNDWRRHINELHNFDKRHALNFRQLDKLRFQCTECHDVVCSAKLKGLQDHKFRHLPYKLYIKCLLCSTCYNHKPNMMTHLRVRHNLIDTRMPSNMQEKDYDDPSPPRQAEFKPTPPINIRPPSHSFKPVEDYVSNHNAVDHDTITYYCPQCNENFVTHAVWRKHIVTEHDLNNARGLNFRQLDEHHYLCLQCYKRVTVTHTKGAIGQLQSHKFRHLPYRSFKCLACDGLFVRKQMFFKHLNRVTNRCDADRRPETDDSVGRNESYAHMSEFQRNDANANVNMNISVNAKSNNDINGSVRRQKHNQTSDSTQIAFSILCPQCGIDFDSWRLWREHINVEHSLGRRECLNFTKLHSMLHKCLECHDCVHGKKLRDLQIHKFKHMPFGDYLRCRFCPSTYYYLRNMSQHLLQKHPEEMSKHERTQELLHDETSRSSATVNDDDDEDDTFVGGDDADANNEPIDDDGVNAENEDDDDDDEDAADEDSENTEQRDNDDDDDDDEMVIPECEVEEVEPIEEAEEQFVLG